MERKTAADFHPEVLRSFDRYVHGFIDRHGFLDTVKNYAVGGVTATMLLEALSPQFALAQKVRKDDPRIKASYVEYASLQGSGTMRGYERINAGWPAYEAALKAAKVKYEMFTYPATEHGFNNDTTPRYDEAAAKLAWERTIAFFNRTLRS